MKSEIGHIDRLLTELKVVLERDRRWSYWKPVLAAAKREHRKNEMAFDAQTLELESAVQLLEELGPQHALEYRRRAYPTLYPRPVGK